MQRRGYKAVGIALLGFGALISLLGLAGGRSSPRVGGPVLAFFGIVMLAQARRRNQVSDHKLRMDAVSDTTDHSVSAPAGWHTITPRIVVHDARGLVEFLQRVLGAKGTYLGTAPTVIRMGDSQIMISDAGERDPMSAFLYVYVADADATYRSAVEAGARALEEPFDTPYGDRRSMVEDRWGNTWQIATRRGPDASPKRER